MLYFVAVWVGLSIICCVIGTALLNRVQADEFSRLGDRAIVSIWLGIVVLATSLLATSLVAPLSPLTGLLVAVGLMAASLSDRRTRLELASLHTTLSKYRILLGISLAWFVAALTTGSVTWIDTGLYHYSNIQWLATYGSTRGIALLLSNFGFTSSWFALAAPLNATWLDARVVSVTNGFALWVTILCLVVCSNRCVRQPVPHFSDWFLTAYCLVLLPIVILHPLFSEMLVSAAPEISVMFLTGITAWSLVITLQNHDRSSAITQTVPLMLAAGSMTLKLVAIPLLLVIGLCYLTLSKSILNRLAIGGGILGLIVVPFLASSLITSGCPLYPSTLFCLDVPWAPTHTNIEKVAKATHGVTSWFNDAPSGINPWLWAMGQSFMKDHTSLAIVLVGIGALFLIIYAIKRFRLQQLGIYGWIVGMTITGMAFLLLTAPFSRFTLPYIVLTLALALAILGMQIYSHPAARSVLTTINQQLTKFARFQVLLLPMMAVIVIGIGISATDRLILPLPMKNDPIVQKQVNNIHYWSPMVKSDTTGKLCWSAPIPCAFEITSDVWLRDPSQGIAGGFVRH